MYSWKVWLGTLRMRISVKVMQTRLQKMHRKCMEFLKLETNRTQLQLIRSCAFLLSLISRVKQMHEVCCGVTKARVHSKN